MLIFNYWSEAKYGTIANVIILIALVLGYLKHLKNIECLHIKKYSATTTHSNNRFYKYRNIIKHININRPNQVCVSHITNIKTVKGVCYLALITNMHSKQIVDDALSDNLELKRCLSVLNKPVYQAKNSEGLLHHFVRGIQ